MFKDDYKNQIENIKPDGYIKDKVRRKLLNETEAPKGKSYKVYFGRAVAAAVCIALVFSLGAVIGRVTAPSTPTVQSADIMKTADDYDNIYSTLNVFKKSIWDKLRDYATGGAKNEILYEYATEDAAGTNGMIDAETTVEEDGLDSTANKEHSETNIQVEGVDEADIIKTDGSYIYILSHSDGKEKIKIVEVGDNPKQLSGITIEEDANASQLFLSEDRLVVLCGVNGKSEVLALIYDISNPSEPKKIEACTQSGYLETSRLIGNKLYLISNFYVNVNNMIKSNTESYVPYIRCGEFDGAVAPDTVHFYEECKSPEYTIISAFDIDDCSLISTQSVLGGSETVYASTNNIITAGMANQNKTEIARFKIQDGVIELKASAELSGTLLNQFSIDEYKDHFRFVLTETVTSKEETSDTASTFVEKISDNTTTNSLVILDNDLKITGEITDIAPDERVYSVRFMGDTAYFVTFRQVDPLFSVDVSDPKNPKIIGALKIPGFSNYLFPYGDGKLLGIGREADEATGEVGNMKLSMFDISDPANVTESDKTIISALYSEALYNHKAVLADYNKNIIAFAAYGIFNSNNFFVYSYENGNFIKKLDVETPINSSLCRGIYIGKILYIITDNYIEYYDISSFEKIGNLKLE